MRDLVDLQHFSTIGHTTKFLNEYIKRNVNSQIPAAYGFREKSERLVIVGDFLTMWKGAIEPQFMDVTV
jgi:hypothetical protein